MKFLLDQGLPRSTVRHLQEIRLEAEHVGNLGLATATDEAILVEARTRDAIVVTLDSDFHALPARSNASLPSVIRIRIQGLKGEAVALIVDQVVKSVERELLEGAAVTVTDRRISLRRLRLVPEDRSGRPNDSQ